MLKCKIKNKKNFIDDVISADFVHAVIYYSCKTLFIWIKQEGFNIFYCLLSCQFCGNNMFKKIKFAWGNKGENCEKKN